MNLEADLRQALSEAAKHVELVSDGWQENTRRVQHRRRRRGASLVLVATAASLAAILVVRSAQSASSPDIVIPATSATASPDTLTPAPPSAMIGNWAVTAEGLEAGAVLSIGEEMTLWLQCGELTMPWVANTSGMFIAGHAGGSMACYPQGHNPQPVWMLQARSFRVDGTSRQLLDANGFVVAALAPGASPTPRPDIIDSAANPHITQALQDEWTRSTPHAIPAPWTPASLDSLTGKWAPSVLGSRPATRSPGATFDRDGTYSASDGCNGYGDRWTIGDQGAFLSVEGASAGVGCGGTAIPVEQWVLSASSVGIRENTIAFFDHTGELLGTLIRQS